MNKHILMAIDHQLNPDKHTKAQLQDNAYDAFYVSSAMSNAANACCMSANENKNQLINESINEYLRLTGENKQDYIDAINKDNK